MQPTRRGGVISTLDNRSSLLHPSSPQIWTEYIKACVIMESPLSLSLSFASASPQLRPLSPLFLSRLYSSLSCVAHTMTRNMSDSTRAVYRKKAKRIIAHGPIPYGTIPKRASKQSTPNVCGVSHKTFDQHAHAQTKQKTKGSFPSAGGSGSGGGGAPYPYFDMSSMSFIERILSLFMPKDDVSSSPVGFMPCPTISTDVATSPLDVFVPSFDESSLDDASSYLSAATTSSSGGSSTSSSSSSSYTCPNLEECAASSESSATTSCTSTTILSDLLCDHYIQSTLRSNNNDDHDEKPRDVPLETFGIFEAPSPDEDEQWFVWQSPKHWKPVADDPRSLKPSEDDDDDDDVDDGSNHHNHHHQTRKKAAALKPARRVRDVRANCAHLRTIVAEANMMRAQKIVGPLRPRGYLPKRLDPFLPDRPSCLRREYLPPDDDDDIVDDDGDE